MLGSVPEGVALLGRGRGPEGVVALQGARSGACAGDGGISPGCSGAVTVGSREGGGGETGGVADGGATAAA